jgi:hypothetical protein
LIQPEPSSLSLVAAAFYGAVVVSCVLALAAARDRRQIRWHVTGWSVLAMLFIILAAMRLFAVEDILRDGLRELLRAEGTYDSRRALQGPIFATLFVIAAAMGGFWFFHVSRTIRGRRNIAAMLAIASGCSLLFLLMVRIVSLHAMDELLYGPLKLNWVIDLGSSAVVLAAGFYYWRLVTGRLR